MKLSFLFYDLFRSQRLLTAATLILLSAHSVQAQEGGNAPSVKDVGFFGNFEIGAGFGAQKASGVGGVVAGLNDGDNPGRPKAGRKVQTLEGEEYVVPFLDSTRDIETCTKTSKPHHRIKVTSPVFVKFSEGVELHGPHLAICNTRVGSMPLELLPGDYEVYVGGGGKNYTLTLTEAASPYPASNQIIASPGFKQVNTKILALRPDYWKNPIARPLELEVTQPMWLDFDVRFIKHSTGEFPQEIEARDKDIVIFKEGKKERMNFYTRMLDESGQRVRPRSFENSRFFYYPIYFEAGKYKIYGKSYRRPRGYENGATSPELFDLTIREETRYTARHVMLDKNFTSTKFAGLAVANTEPDKENAFGSCRRKRYWDRQLVHRLKVEVPQMVSIRVDTTKNTPKGYNLGNPSFVFLRRISGDAWEYCSTGSYDVAQAQAFLVPGEYEIYIGHESKNAFFYDINITGSTKQ